MIWKVNTGKITQSNDNALKIQIADNEPKGGVSSHIVEMPAKTQKPKGSSSESLPNLQEASGIENCSWVKDVLGYYASAVKASGTKKLVKHGGFYANVLEFGAILNEEVLNGKRVIKLQDYKNIAQKSFLQYLKDDIKNYEGDIFTGFNPEDVIIINSNQGCEARFIRKNFRCYLNKDEYLHLGSHYKCNYDRKIFYLKDEIVEGWHLLFNKGLFL